QRPPPRAAADEPGRQRELADESPRTLGTSEDLLDEGAKRPSECELVRDRFREGQPLHDLPGRPATADPGPLASVRLLPGSVAARAETLGDCGAGQARQLP